MTADELYDLFRSDMVDTATPPLWSDDEVWNYMDDAYKTFVRLTGGIPDSTSDLTLVTVVAGEPTAEVSPLILKYRTAYLLSSGRRLNIINDMDEPLAAQSDYGSNRIGARIDAPGTVQSIMVGLERNSRRGLVRWVRPPLVSDTCQLSVYRLPLDKAAAGYDFYEIGEEHVVNLLLWMKYRAYGKQDAETFDRGRRDENKALFGQYCTDTKAEWDRYKSKVNVVEYGGL